MAVPLGTTRKTGETCPESGVWEVVGDGSTIPLSKGETFPPHKGQAVTWRLKQYA